MDVRVNEWIRYLRGGTPATVALVVDAVVVVVVAVVWTKGAVALTWTNEEKREYVNANWTWLIDSCLYLGVVTVEVDSMNQTWNLLISLTGRDVTEQLMKLAHLCKHMRVWYNW